MTGSDVIVLAPWIVFGAGMTVICLRLLRSRRPSWRPPEPPQAPNPHGSKEPGRVPGAVPRCPEQTAGCNQREATSS